ncbi:MAG: hypothetical protein KAI61_02605 [Alphaproteobacteria bacterium]|nr:hypothetical protein [Alphaproteobacteria bacterium]MCK5555475.1 hypothetical protein [Alphaproteobacteria bacterium]MCK5658845.1 hypothetical protein [Alphaproteobacteria bacterium]
MPEEQPAFVVAYRENQELFNSLVGVVNKLEDDIDPKKPNSVKNQPSPK